MKPRAFLGLILLSIATAWGVCASEGVDDVLKLQNSGVGEEVMIAFVQNSQVAYNPSADEIASMEKAGVSATVIMAMIDRGHDLRGEASTAANMPAAPDTTTADDSNTPPTDTLPPAATVSADNTAALYVPPEADMNISYFYGSLAPYGEWVEVDGYGQCWRPRVVTTVEDWRPYCNDGNWVYTDSGWFWESTYPWGWATFHYGRWYQDTRLGWVWAPDTVWGPAWVSWRNSESHCGWAPLPPEARFEARIGFSFRGKVGFDLDFGLSERAYTFVPTESFFAANLAVVRVPDREVHTVYSRTTVVNNTYVYNDNRVINRGVAVETISARTKRHITPLQIADLRASQGQALARGEVRTNNQIQVFRPALRNSTPLAPKEATVRFQGDLKVAAARSTRVGATPVPASSAQRRLELEKQRLKTGASESAPPRNAGPATDPKRGDAERKANEDAARKRLEEEQARKAGEKQKDSKAEAGEEAAKRLEVERKAKEEDARKRLEEEQARKAGEKQKDSKAEAGEEAAKRLEAERNAKEDAQRKADAAARKPQEEHAQRPAPNAEGQRKAPEEAQRNQQKDEQKDSKDDDDKRKGK